jgi:hypothetical protein
MLFGPFLQIAIPDHRVYIGQGFKQIKFDRNYRCLYLSQVVEYEPYCDDFGPMNVSSTIDFIRWLDKARELDKNLTENYCGHRRARCA